MPTEIDVKLAEDLADFRVDVEKRFGSVGQVLAGVERELKFIRWIGTFFAGVLFVLVTGVVTVAWNASAVVSEVRYQRERLEEVRTDVRQQGKALEELLRRTAPKAEGSR
jgi:hypothetical protein